MGKKMADKPMTVGEVQNLLSKFDPNRPFVLYDWYWDDSFKEIEVVDGNNEETCGGCKGSVVLRRAL